MLTSKGASTEVGMYDPQSGRYEPLGTHGAAVLKKVVTDLRIRMEKQGYWVSFCQRTQ